MRPINIEFLTKSSEAEVSWLSEELIDALNTKNSEMPDAVTRTMSPATNGIIIFAFKLLITQSLINIFSDAGPAVSATQAPRW